MFKHSHVNIPSGHQTCLQNLELAMEVAGNIIGHYCWWIFQIFHGPPWGRLAIGQLSYRQNHRVSHKSLVDVPSMNSGWTLGILNYMRLIKPSTIALCYTRLWHGYRPFGNWDPHPKPLLDCVFRLHGFTASTCPTCFLSLVLPQLSNNSPIFTYSWHMFQQKSPFFTRPFAPLPEASEFSLTTAMEWVSRPWRINFSAPRRCETCGGFQAMGGTMVTPIAGGFISRKIRSINGWFGYGDRDFRNPPSLWWSRHAQSLQ